MASGIYLNESVWSSPLVGYNKKQNRRVVDLRWKKRSRIMLSEAPYITKLPLGRATLKKKKKNNKKKEKCDFLKIFFSGFLKKLSGLVIVY